MSKSKSIVKARSSELVELSGPYKLAPKGYGLVLEREPTQEEAEQALTVIAATDDMSSWWLADWSATLPNELRNTYKLAEDHFAYKYSSNYLENLSMLAKKVPHNQRRWDVSISHYVCVWLEFAIPDEKRVEWMDKLEEISTYPSSGGKTMSVAKLRKAIKEDLGFISQVGTVDDNDYQQQINTHRSLQETEKKLEEAEHKLEQVSMLLDTIAGSSPEIVEQLSEALSSKPKRRSVQYRILRNEIGGLDIQVTIMTDAGLSDFLIDRHSVPDLVEEDIQFRLQVKIED